MTIIQVTLIDYLRILFNGNGTDLDKQRTKVKKRETEETRQTLIVSCLAPCNKLIYYLISLDTFYVVDSSYILYQHCLPDSCQTCHACSFEV